MRENDLKRCLIKSIRAQEGVGNRFEDKFSVGFPDLLLIPAPGPVFFVEAKIIRSGSTLECTTLQEVQLNRLHRPRLRSGPWFSHGVIVAWHDRREILYVGRPGDHIDRCRYIPRPRRLDSTDWDISGLLMKYDDDRADDDIPSREEIDAHADL